MTKEQLEKEVLKLRKDLKEKEHLEKAVEAKNLELVTLKKEQAKVIKELEEKHNKEKEELIKIKDGQFRGLLEKYNILIQDFNELDADFQAVLHITQGATELAVSKRDALLEKMRNRK